MSLRSLHPECLGALHVMGDALVTARTDGQGDTDELLGLGRKGAVGVGVAVEITERGEEAIDIGQPPVESRPSIVERLDVDVRSVRTKSLRMPLVVERSLGSWGVRAMTGTIVTVTVKDDRCGRVPVTLQLS